MMFFSRENLIWASRDWVHNSFSTQLKYLFVLTIDMIAMAAKIANFMVLIVHLLLSAATV